jgi:hypothetical protein
MGPVNVKFKFEIIMLSPRSRKEIEADFLFISS